MNYDNYKERKKTFAPDALPISVQREIYIHYSITGSNAGQIEIWDCDLSGENRILLNKQTVTAYIPQNLDLKKQVVSALENEIQKTQAEAHKKVSELKARIESLLCLEYNPNGGAVMDITANDVPF